MSNETKYYHGGDPSLEVGEFILPPLETGVTPVVSYMPDQSRVSHVRNDRVFLSTDVNAAMMFAVMHPSKRGRVYEVTPVGELTPDPDCFQEGLSWEAEKAEIVSIVNLDEATRKLILSIFMEGDDNG